MVKQIKNTLSTDIMKSSAGILLITVLIKVLGYAEKLLLAKYFGTSLQVDVYTVVLTILLSLFFFFREVIEPGYLNVFLDIKLNQEKKAWALFNGVFRVVLFITLVLTIVAVVFPGAYSGVFAPGFEGEKLELTNKLIKVALPAVIFLALSTLTSITLNGLKIFVLPASGELAFKGGILLFMVLFYKEYGIIGATIGILIGSVGRLGVHLMKLYKKISFTKANVDPIYKKRIWQLTWPLLLGVGFSQISALVDNIFASYLQDGAIAALSYARKVVELPVILFPYIISIVVFPYFTQLAVEKQNEKLQKLIGDALKWIVIAFLPISIFFILFSHPIIEIIFQRGAFNSDSTLLTSQPFVIYSFGLVFFAIETILVIFYYSNADTKTPVFIGMACVAINILLTWLFVNIIGYVGIALAFVIQKVLKNVILLIFLRSKIKIDMAKVRGFMFSVMIPFIGVVILFIFLRSLFLHLSNENTIIKLLMLSGIFCIGAVGYLISLYNTGALKSLIKLVK